MSGKLRVGTSGWSYPPWQKVFYPRGLSPTKQLDYLSHKVNSVEINASFYALQTPERYRHWREQTPSDFLFSVKGPQLITHRKRLLHCENYLTDFFASGVLELGPKLGPILWQLPPYMEFEAHRLRNFFSALPRTAKAAARSDENSIDAGQTIRYALEVRHPSFITDEAIGIMREHEVALVTADTAGKWPLSEETTAEFRYVRLHGEHELYSGRYQTQTLYQWAEKILNWQGSGHDVYIYFDNTTFGEAPADALALMRYLGLAIPQHGGVLR